MARRDRDDEFDVRNAATVKSTKINQHFQAGFAEARAMRGLGLVVKVTLKFEGHKMNVREFEAVDGPELTVALKQALEWAGTHLLQGADTEVTIAVEYVNDVPGTEVVEAEVVENG